MTSGRSWETGPEREGLLEFKVKDSDFLPLLGVFGCVVKGWPVPTGHSLWPCLLVSEPQTGEQPPLLELAVVL